MFFIAFNGPPSCFRPHLGTETEGHQVPDHTMDERHKMKNCLRMSKLRHGPKFDASRVVPSRKRLENHLWNLWKVPSFPHGDSSEINDQEMWFLLYSMSVKLTRPCPHTDFLFLPVRTADLFIHIVQGIPQWLLLDCCTSWGRGH